MLRTNIDLDEKLVNEGLKLTQMKTKKDLVNFALKELVTKLKRKKMLSEVYGKVQWEGDLSEMRESRT